MDSNGITDQPQQPIKPQRAPRGSYSKLICLNCRSRKIKCILPVQDDSIQPSNSPQPPDRACVRCQQQQLECIIDKTILGRPSSKRKQQGDSPQALRSKSLGSSDTPPSTIFGDVVDKDDVDVAGFMLADVEDEIDQVAARLPRKDRPEEHEVYQALIDPYHLISTVIRRDKKFGAACNTSPAQLGADPIRLLHGPVIDSIDERLAWVRLYFPYVPKLSVLLREHIAPTVVAIAPAVSTQALVLILTLIAIDAQSVEPLPKELSRDSVVTALGRCGLELLFTPPTHRHTIYALELIMEYWPTALVTSQNGAAPCLKGELYVTLMKRVSDKLALETAPKTLRAKLTNPTAPTEEISKLVYDSLLWGRICYLDVSIGALITKTPADLHEVREQLQDATSAVSAAFSRYLHLSAATKFSHLRLVIRMSEVHAYGDIKAHRNDLAFLSTIKEAHVRAAVDQKRACQALLERHKPSEQIDVIKELVSFEVDFIHENVSQHVLSYGVMSSYLLPDADPTMADVLKIGEQIVANIKAAVEWGASSPALKDESLTGLPIFLVRFGPSRPGEMCQHMKNIIKGRSKLLLNGIPWQPPSRETAACVLYQCKLLVEENAARMKGWAWLCEDVDTQLLLFEDCARALVKMDMYTAEGKPSALEQGSVMAAAAKLMRALGTIVSSWKSRLAEQESRAIAGVGQFDQHDPTTPPLPIEPSAWKVAERAAMRSHPLGGDEPAPVPIAQPIYGSGVNMWDTTNMPGWTEVNFDDWSAWPQATPVVDFWNGMSHEEVNHALAASQFRF